MILGGFRPDPTVSERIEGRVGGVEVTGMMKSNDRLIPENPLISLTPPSSVR
jgi:hypothetical protein